MPISSIQDRVSHIVKELRQRILTLRSRPSSIGEENTKRVLINPLLQALDWDVLDVDEVHNEYRSQPQDNPVDYAMFLQQAASLFMEAKALGNSLQDRRWTGQTISYAAVAGVDWCVLTNGDEYRIYYTHAPVDAEQKLFRSVRISDSSMHNITVNTLILLSKDQMRAKVISDIWAEEFIDRRVKSQLSHIFRDNDELAGIISRNIPGLTIPQIKSSLSRFEIKIEQSDRVFDIGGPSNAELSESKSAFEPERIKNLAETALESKPGTAAKKSLLQLIHARRLPLPLVIEATTGGKRVEAVILADGRIQFGGQIYNSVSLAGADAAGWATCNGWTFWSFADPKTGALVRLNELRSVK